MAKGSLNFAFFSTNNQSGIGDVVECCIVSVPEVVESEMMPPDSSEGSLIPGQLSNWDPSPFFILSATLNKVPRK